MCVERVVHQGCPQGSILGPDFWNVVFDELLLALEDSGARVIAYADDLCIIVNGNSRRELERTGQEFTDIAATWFRRQSLTVSESKTEMLLLRDTPAAGRQTTVTGLVRIQARRGCATGSLARPGKGGIRPPSIKINGKTIRYGKSVRYLGIHIGTRFSFAPHLDYLSLKARRLINSLGILGRNTWGISFGSLQLLYKTVFLPTVLYASSIWGLAARSHAKKLTTIQRSALLRTVRAYRTVSTAALQVLCGQAPIELLLREEYYKFRVRKEIPFQDGDIAFIPGLAKEVALQTVKDKTLAD